MPKTSLSVQLSNDLAVLLGVSLRAVRARKVNKKLYTRMSLALFLPDIKHGQRPNVYKHKVENPNTMYSCNGILLSKIMGETTHMTTSPERSQAQTCTLHNSGDMAFSKPAKVTCNDRNLISGWVWVESWLEGRFVAVETFRVLVWVRSHGTRRIREDCVNSALEWATVYTWYLKESHFEVFVS